VLTACVLGLAVCPVVYIAIGALSRFPPRFSLVMLPPYVLGGGYLLWRYLSRPSEPRRQLPLALVEAVSWLPVGVLLYFISGFALMTSIERIGAASAAFLVSSGACLPIVLARPASLERRLARLPRPVLVAVTFLVLMASGLAAMFYLKRPARFI
jgi:drug/metabolite transporter (DMT)-like permease